MIRRLWCATWLGHRPYRMVWMPTHTRRCLCGRVEVGGEDWFRDRHPWDRLTRPTYVVSDWGATITLETLGSPDVIPSALDMVGHMDRVEHTRWLHGA